MMRYKNILKALGFWTLAAVIFGLIQPLYLDQGEVLRWQDFKRVEKNSIDIIFLGSSHAYHSFDPEVIDDLIPIQSFALGIPGDNLPILFYEVEEILNHQSPSVIAIDAFTFSLSHWHEGSFVYRFLNSGFNIRYLRYAVNILCKNDYEWWNFFPSIRYPDEWKNPENFINNPKSKTPLEFVHNAQGFAPLENIIQDQRYQEMPLEDYIPQPDNYLESMWKIINLSRKKNFEIMFFDSVWYGFSNPVFDLYDPSAEYALIEEEGLDYVDFRAAPLAYDWEQIHLYDVDHPSSFGSLILSVRMAEYLAQKLGLPLDEEQKAYYETYFFDDHHIDRDEQELKIELIPADENSPLLYAWEVTFEGQIIESQEFNANPSFTFELSRTGEYLIRVKIWNPKGDFVLTAVFPYTME